MKKLQVYNLADHHAPIITEQKITHPKQKKKRIKGQLTQLAEQKEQTALFTKTLLLSLSTGTTETSSTPKKKQIKWLLRQLKFCSILHLNISPRCSHLSSFRKMTSITTF